MNFTIRGYNKIEIEMKDELLEAVGMIQDKIASVMSSSSN